ncbi:MAG: hypothetical protein ABIY50_07660 [Ignavibacteria bacterium]
MKVGILRCENLPAFAEGDIKDYDELFDDDRLLIAGFESQGHEASSIIWSDPNIEWEKFDMAIIRSTWDYIDRREEFLNVLSKIESSQCKLFNPLNAVRWNSDKLYLFELQQWEIPIIPTYKADECDFMVLQNYFAENNWQEAVIKPAVGAGGAGVQRILINEIAKEYKNLSLKQTHQKYLIQPLINSVISEGEYSYIYINGDLSHVLLKKPAHGDFRAHGIYGGTIVYVEPEKNDILQADNIMTKLPFDVLYARLDLARIDNTLAVMEIELIEPVLYFNLASGGIEQMVNAAIMKSKG